MILAFDTYYYDGKARTVCISFHTWTDKEPADTLIEVLSCDQEYIPGEFYKRELPGIVSLLNNMDLGSIEAIIIDGFVVLNDEGKLGLGGYLYEHLEKKVPIIGVAKRSFFELKELRSTVYRGTSNQALYVTALGLDLDSASHHIKQMHGSFRIPTLLKFLDQLTKAF